MRRVPHRYIRSEGLVTFPNESRIVIGHFRTENDVDQYLGLEYDVILVEEATTLSDTKYRALRDSNRTSKDFRPRIYTTANPGGIGHVWYKNRFVDPFRNREELDTRFIPATIEDNSVIDPDYRRKLEENSGWKLRAHRYGDWEIAAGQFLDSFRYEEHVIEPFPTPPEWHYFLGMDYGYKHPTVFLLLAADGDDNIYVIDEHVQSGWLPQQHAAAVKAMVERNGASHEALWHVYSGPDIFAQRSELTIADHYNDEDLYFNKAETDRIQGANEVRTRLGNVDMGIATFPLHLQPLPPPHRMPAQLAERPQKPRRRAQSERKRRWSRRRRHLRRPPLRRHYARVRQIGIRMSRNPCPHQSNRTKVLSLSSPLFTLSPFDGRSAASGLPCAPTSQSKPPRTVQFIVRGRKFRWSVATGGPFLGRKNEDNW